MTSDLYGDRQLIFEIDSGYLKICPCGSRHGINHLLAGISRFVDIEPCEKCLKTKKKTEEEIH